MEDALQSELRALQARAYGPGDGLVGDDAARRRLHELEALARAERTRPEVAQSVTDAAAPRRPQVPPLPSVAPTEAARTFAASRVETETDQQKRRRRRLTGLAWAGSLAMAATLAVGVTAAVTSRSVWTGATVPPGAGITHVATLAVDTDREWPEAYGGRPQDGEIFEALGEITPIVGSMPTEQGLMSCVQLLPPEAWQPANDNGWAWSGFGGCSAHPFPATASIIVGPDAPASLRERFAERVRLQFVAGDGVVEVFSADPPAAEATR